MNNAEAGLLRSLQGSQRAAIEGHHPKAAVRRPAMSMVAEHTEAVLRLWDAST